MNHVFIALEKYDIYIYIYLRIYPLLWAKALSFSSSPSSAQTQFRYVSRIYFRVNYSSTHLKNVLVKLDHFPRDLLPLLPLLNNIMFELPPPTQHLTISLRVQLKILTKIQAFLPRYHPTNRIPKRVSQTQGSPGWDALGVCHRRDSWCWMSLEITKGTLLLLHTKNTGNLMEIKTTPEIPTKEINGLATEIVWGCHANIWDLLVHWLGVGGNFWAY